jgi:hypothetical protein
MEVHFKRERQGSWPRLYAKYELERDEVPIVNELHVFDRQIWDGGAVGTARKIMSIIIGVFVGLFCGLGVSANRLHGFGRVMLQNRLQPKHGSNPALVSRCAR